MASDSEGEWRTREDCAIRERKVAVDQAAVSLPIDCQAVNSVRERAVTVSDFCSPDGVAKLMACPADSPINAAPIGVRTETRPEPMSAAFG